MGKHGMGTFSVVLLEAGPKVRPGGVADAI